MDQKTGMCCDEAAMTQQDWVRWYGELLARCGGGQTIRDVILDYAAKDDDLDCEGFSELHDLLYPTEI